MTNTQAGWYPDPYNKNVLRWWDGRSWTAHVAANGAIAFSPIPVQPELTSAPARTSPPLFSRLPIWAWALIAVVALVILITLPRVVALLALVVLVTGIVALSKGTPTWLKLRTRGIAAAVTGASAVVLLIAGTLGPITPATTADQETTADRAPLAGESAEPSPTSTWREEVVTEPIPFEQVTVEDPNLTRGQTVVTVVGQDGAKTLTYDVEYQNGREVARKLLTVVTSPPIAEVTALGAYDAPPPAAFVDSGCDPNYADACVPISSDVDCAWGSGNGPAYFDGVALVVGSDIYDLDRDGNGYACEQ